MLMLESGGVGEAHSISAYFIRLNLETGGCLYM